MLQQERDKYQRMWARPEYRQWSPGESAVSAFLEQVPWEAGDTLFDLGCGTGRAGRLLAEKGFRVTLLDLCSDAIEVKELPFIEASLWSLPPGLQPRDWLYCVDVLEHLPTEYIGSTLDDLARLTLKGGFFKIALFEDACGSLIGESLHLTIKSALWWLQQFKIRWPIEQVTEDGGYLTLYVGGRQRAK